MVHDVDDALLPIPRSVTLIGGGPVAAEDLAAALAIAPRLIAADGGADRALALGRQPEQVIGDLDSLSAAGRERLAGRILRVEEQETTDLEKCLSRIEAPLILGLGFLEGRLDHTLAALNVIHREAKPVILLGQEDIVFALRRDLCIDLPAGMRLSLFPMRAVTARSEGLRWPLDAMRFAPDSAIGTSNEVTGPVRISPDGPGLLVLLPPEALGAVLAGLQRAPGG